MSSHLILQKVYYRLPAKDTSKKNYLSLLKLLLQEVKDTIDIGALYRVMGKCYEMHQVCCMYNMSLSTK